MSENALPVVICDDSLMARKQMARALKNWHVDISFAENGEEALTAIEAGKADMLFLDLNMPVMDGYETLEHIRARDLQCLVIVVSGDIQAEAQQRVKELGALEFIKKPIDGDILSGILRDYGLLHELEGQANSSAAPQISEAELSLANFCQEVSNVAMGRAVELLSKVMKAFINMPIPNVKQINYAQFVEYVEQHRQSQHYLVSQSFMTRGVAGEVIVAYPGDSAARLAGLMQRDEQTIAKDLVLDVTNLLSGAFLRALGEQIDMDFIDMPPMIIARQQSYDQKKPQWQKALCIELNYEIEEYELECHLQLILTEDSLPVFEERARFMS